ncbi:E3 ubiquitin-protein ligase ATL41 [Senna tora]|uniref:RING-type E3 ubiquitin transferase n=1 Tax=Senna tora TaxID=362788 RepID=A0A834VZI6_9FABA|nr:E3 ubiquitin-protein ligase ATL41 [Senna tora]
MGFDDDDHYAHEKLSTGLKAMLAAAFSLFTILILVIAFHWILRRRRNRQLQRRLHDHLVHQIGSQIAPIDADEDPRFPANHHHHQRKGLEASVIASLPKVSYKETERFGRAESSMECSVCLVTIGEDATVRVLPNCKHLFHVDCVDKWFGSNTTCPICRTQAEPKVGAVRPTAPPEEEGSDVNSDGLGLRVTSFRSMIDSCDGWLRHLQIP